jgi:hypothetical protein
VKDSSELEVRSDVVALAARIRELEALLVRTPLVLGRADEGSTNACTNCASNCTNCRGDKFIDVLLPGEDAPLSGSELVNRVRATRGQ